MRSREKIGHMVYQVETPGAVDERFRHNMRRIRDLRGLSQGELSRILVGMGWKVFHQTTVSRIEDGTRPVKLSEALAIARALEIEFDLLLSSSPDVEIVESLINAITNVEDRQHNYGVWRGLLLESIEELEAVLDGAKQVDTSSWPERELRQRLENLKMRAAQLIKGAKLAIEQAGSRPSDLDAAAHKLLEEHVANDDRVLGPATIRSHGGESPEAP